MGKIKYLIISIIIILQIQSASAQVKVKDTKEYKQAKAVYNRALRYNDIEVAKTTLFDLIALDPDDVSLLDSLAYIYFDYQQHANTILVCMDILRRNTNALHAVEMRAISYENLGLYDKALTDYETLYLKNNNVATLYKMAFLQYDLKRFNESLTNADIILGSKDTDSLKVVFGQSGNVKKEIPMRAAVVNLKGLIHKSKNENAEARKQFEEALKISPDFELAKANIKELDKTTGSQTTTATTPAAKTEEKDQPKKKKK